MMYKVTMVTFVSAKSEAEARFAVRDISQGWDCVEGFMACEVISVVEDTGAEAEGEDT